MSPSAALLLNHPLFVGHPDLLELASPQVKYKTFAKDDVVLLHSAPAESLWLVISGWVSLSRQTPDGKESVIALCSAGDVFGEAALFAHASYPYTAIVVDEGTELASIPAATLRHLVRDHAEFSAHVMEILGARITKAELKLEQMSTLTAAQRLGCFLLRLCQTQATGSKDIRIPVEKHLVASYLGMKPETFSRSLQQLGEVGIKASGSTVNVGNIARLRDFVCGSCGESGMCATEEDAMSAAPVPVRG